MCKFPPNTGFPSRSFRIRIRRRAALQSGKRGVGDQGPLRTGVSRQTITTTHKVRLVHPSTSFLGPRLLFSYIWFPSSSVLVSARGLAATMLMLLFFRWDESLIYLYPVLTLLRHVSTLNRPPPTTALRDLCAFKACGGRDHRLWRIWVNVKSRIMCLLRPAYEAEPRCALQ